ncbi:hypothetical protein CsatB_011952 [Cannabis sativa]
MAGSVDMMINQYEFNNEELFEVSAGLINGDFLMSLMEELQDHDDDDLVVLEESDEDRLNSVIQSLEAEINCSSTNYSDDDEQDHSSSMDSDHDNSKDHEYSISDGEDSHESCSLMENHDNNNNNHHDHDYCSIISFDDIDIMNNNDQWVSMEADQVPTSSPGHELNYYMYHFGEEMMISTSTHNINNQYSSYSLDQEQSGYNSLWQETIYDDAQM